MSCRSSDSDGSGSRRNASLIPVGEALCFGGRASEQPLRYAMYVCMDVV